MDKLTKFLKKQNKKARIHILKLIEKVLKNELKGIDVIRLSGKKNLFRLKQGRVRILFKKTGRGHEVVNATYRDEGTYKNI